jgi:hypothetical protein
MTRSDRWIGGLFLLLGVFIAHEAAKLEFASSYGAGSGFFPYWLGVVIIILGAVIVALGARSSIPSLAGDVAGAELKRKALAYSGIMGFVVGLPFLGFATALALLVGFLLKLEGEDWRTVCVVALASGIGFYLFFIRLLAVELPMGPLGF